MDTLLFVSKLLEKTRMKEIKKLTSTKAELTGNENRGDDGGLTGKNDYKCYTCGATAHETELQD
jgi:hypothetical protein